MDTRDHYDELKESASSMNFKLSALEQNVFQSLPVAVYTCNAAGFIQTYNNAAETLWGRKPEIGKEQWCGSLKIFNADGSFMPLSACAMAIAITKGTVTNTEIIIEKPGGEQRHVIPHPQLVYDEKSGALIGAINTLIDITEQARARKNSEETEVRIRLAVDAAQMGTFDWDLQNEVFLSSPRLISIFGFDTQDKVSHKDLIATFHPEDKPLRDQAVQEAYHKGSLVYEARVFWKDKSIHWIKVCGKVLYDEKKEPVRMYGTVIDITAEKAADENLRESEARFRQIADLMPQMVWTVRPDGVMDYHNRQWYEYTGVEPGKGDENKMVVLHPDDEQKCIDAFTHSMKTGELYQVEFRLKHRNQPDQYRWFLGRAIPVRDAENKIIKWLGTSTDIDDHKNFASHLENKVKERTLELQEKNQFVQTLLDSSVDMIIVLDKQLRFLSLNKTADDLFKQYLPDSIIGKTMIEVDPTVIERQTYTDMIECFNGVPIYRKEVKSTVIDNYYDLHYVPLKNESETYAVMLITRDVTATVLSRQALETANLKLKERNEFIEAIIDTSQNYIAVYDIETRLVSLNLSSEKMLNGKTRDEVLGGKLRDIFPAAKGSKSEKDLLKALAGEEVRNDIFYSSISNKYLQNCITPLRNENGDVYAALVTAYDMTELKKSEEELKSVNLQLTEAQRLAHIGSWEWDIASNQINWTDELYRIFGVSPQTYHNSFENYVQAIHPDDRDYIIEAIQLARDEQIPYDFTHRIIQPSGAVRTLHAKGLAVTDKQNNTIKLVGTAQDITETLELAFRLKQSEIRHHLMIDQIEDYAIIFLNTEGMIEDWNLGAEKIKGYTESEIIGKHFSIFYPAAEQAEKIPDKILEEARQNKKAHYEGWRIRKDGSKFWASVLVTALTGENNKLIGYSKLTRDLTEQLVAAEKISQQTKRVIEQNAELEKINNELADQKAFAELLIESNPLMILSYDQNMIINTWNKKSEENSRMKKADVLGKRMFEVFPEYNNEAWIKSSEDVLLRGKSLYYPKIKFQYQKGWGESFVIPLRNTRDQIIGLLSITKDITEVVKMNEDIERKNQDLEKMNVELASFSSIASHDLQEPLRKILTFSSRLKDKHQDKLAEDAMSLLAKIESSALRMKTLIQDLLDYSRLISHDSLMEDTRLNEIISNVLNDFELLIEQKKAIIEIDELPVLRAVPLQMNQLFYNLFSNALKFSVADTPPVIKMTAQMLKEKEVKTNPALNSKLSYCKIIFSDNGIGFDQKFAEKIFITFQRLNSTNDYPGTGIGLALSKKIVENHEGQIYVESAEGKGTVFYILLPVAK